MALLHRQLQDGYFPRGSSWLRRVHGERLAGLMCGQRALCIGACAPLTTGARASPPTRSCWARCLRAYASSTSSASDYRSRRPSTPPPPCEPGDGSCRTASPRLQHPVVQDGRAHREATDRAGRANAAGPRGLNSVGPPGPLRAGPMAAHDPAPSSPRPMSAPRARPCPWRRGHRSASALRKPVRAGSARRRQASQILT